MSFTSFLPSARPLSVIVFSIWIAGPLWAQQDSLNESNAIQNDIDAAAQASQEKIDNLSEQAREMLTQYRGARDQAASLTRYNEQLASLVSSQNEEIDSLDKQLSTIGETQEQFVPLLLQMVATLDKFIQRDIPFLATERSERVNELNTLMDSANVTTAEKFRKVMAAYQTEMEYGRTIEAYREQLDLDGQERTVRLLRVGRIALLYQALNGQDTGRWDQQAREWANLKRGYRASVEEGLRIATEQAPPDLLRIPVPAPAGDK